MPLMFLLMGSRCSWSLTIRLTRSTVFARAAFLSSWEWVRSCSPCWLRFGAGWLELPRLCHCLAWALTAGGSALWFFSLSKLAAKIKAFAGKRKGKMLGKGLSCFGPWVWAHFVVPQVVAAGCAAAAVVVMDWYFQGISSLSAAAILARALISFFAMLCFDVSGTEVVPSFLHGLLREGHVLGLRFGRALAAAAFFAALFDMVAHQFCSCIAAAFVGVFTIVGMAWQGCFQVYCGCATGVSVRL